MKNYCFLLFFLAGFFVGTNAEAQTDQGVMMLGGNASLTKQENFNLFNVFVEPKVGYFLADNLALGSGLRFTYSDNQYTQSRTGWGISPFARYFFNSGGKLLPFAEIGVEYGQTSYSSILAGSQTYSDMTDRQSGFNIGLGASYFIHRLIAFELEGEYSRLTLESLNGGQSSGQRQNTQMQLNFGIQVYFGASEEVD